MKKRPIIFSGPMVRAILEGRKTQTRRVIKPQPKLESLHFPYMSKPEDAYVWRPGKDNTWFAWEKWDFRFDPMMYSDGPFNGDLLWVRETWAQIWECEPPDPTELPEALDSMPWHIEYKADSGTKYPGDWPDDMGDDPDCAKWKSSIHMPKKYARLWLRVTNVRVERVQEITEEDARAEGGPFTLIRGTNGLFDITKDHLPGFIRLWDSLNAKRGYSWESNPWVWIVEFERVKP